MLLAFPAERERWFSYRAELLHWHIHNWLEGHHITEAPGEALRRRARELIEGIPAIDLPSAIAFLEFLRARAADAASRDRDDDDLSDATGDPQRAA